MKWKRRPIYLYKHPLGYFNALMALYLVFTQWEPESCFPWMLCPATCSCIGFETSSKILSYTGPTPSAQPAPSLSVRLHHPMQRSGLPENSKGHLEASLPPASVPRALSQRAAHFNSALVWFSCWKQKILTLQLPCGPTEETVVPLECPEAVELNGGWSLNLANSPISGRYWPCWEPADTCLV